MRRTVKRKFSVLKFAAALICTLNSAHASRGRDVEIDLSSRLLELSHQNSDDQTTTFVKALSLIETLESAPGCDQLATLTLMNSCNPDLRDDGRSIEESSLSSALNEYAARLAVCELLPSRWEVPSQCSVFVPSAQACNHSRLRGLFHQQKRHGAVKLCYPPLHETSLNRCLHSLRATPSTWQSYSNSRQNAKTICQASRIAFEKEKALGVYSSLVEAAFDISNALKQSAQEAQARSTEMAQFADSYSKERQQHIKDIARDRGTMHSVFQELHKNIESLKQSASNAYHQIALDTRTLSSDLRDINQVAQESKQTLKVTHTDMARFHETLVENQKRSLEISQGVWQSIFEKFGALSSYFTNVQAMQQQHLRGLESMTGMINTHQESMSKMHANQATLAEQINTLSGEIKALGESTTGLKATVDGAHISVRDIITSRGLNSRMIICVLIVIILLWDRERGGFFNAPRLLGVITMIYLIQPFLPSPQLFQSLWNTFTTVVGIGIPIQYLTIPLSLGLLFIGLYAMKSLPGLIRTIYHIARLTVVSEAEGLLLPKVEIRT